jgi:hypothetical protein
MILILKLIMSTRTVFHAPENDKCVICRVSKAASIYDISFYIEIMKEQI